MHLYVQESINFSQINRSHNGNSSWSPEMGCLVHMRANTTIPNCHTKCYMLNLIHKGHRGASVDIGLSIHD